MKHKQSPINKLNPFLNKILTTLKHESTSELSGMYIYGSLATGGFNYNSSDCDILVVINSELSNKNRLEIVKSLLPLSNEGPGGGFELTIINRKLLQHFEYPTPIELYFTTDLKEKFISNEIDLTNQKLDEGLAINLFSLKQRGICFFGEPINKIIPDIPAEFYLKSAIYDFAWNYDQVMRNTKSKKVKIPSYVVLNGCRLAILIKSHLYKSKIEGGEWALKNFPNEFGPIISTALKDYVQRDISNEVDSKLLKKFIKYVKTIVDQS